MHKHKILQQTTKNPKEAYKSTRAQWAIELLDKPAVSQSLTCNSLCCEVYKRIAIQFQFYAQLRSNFHVYILSFVVHMHLSSVCYFIKERFSYPFVA